MRTRRGRETRRKEEIEIRDILRKEETSLREGHMRDRGLKVEASTSRMRAGERKDLRMHTKSTLTVNGDTEKGCSSH